jgi:hypothetical protein
VWPRGFTPQQRALFPIQWAHYEANVLYRAPSWYCARSANGEYTRDIGTGLYSSVDLPANRRLVKFNGTVRTREEYEARVLEGKGGYAIHLNAENVLDCYDSQHLCYASMANSSTGVRTTKPGLSAHAQTNCRLVVSNPALGLAHLDTIRPVAAHKELFWVYGEDYIFPV